MKYTTIITFAIFRLLPPAPVDMDDLQITLTTLINKYMVDLFKKHKDLSIFKFYCSPNLYPLHELISKAFNSFEFNQTVDVKYNYNYDNKNVESLYKAINNTDGLIKNEIIIIDLNKDEITCQKTLSENLKLLDKVIHANENFQDKDNIYLYKK